MRTKTYRAHLSKAGNRNLSARLSRLIGLAALAATLTLAAGCTEDGPGSMTEAEPETLDAKTLDKIMSVGVAPLIDGCQSLWSLKWRMDKPKSEAEARTIVIERCAGSRSDAELEQALQRLVPRLTSPALRLDKVPVPPSDGWWVPQTGRTASGRKVQK